ncbi:MAG: hypothetical protein V1714_04645 [Pseudomonadota bacterium]
MQKKGIKPKGKIGDVAVWCDHSDIVYLDQLKKHPRNPNTHPPEQIERLAELIKFHG